MKRSIVAFVIAFPGIFITVTCADDQAQRFEPVLTTLITPRDTSSLAIVSRGPADSLYTYECYRDDNLVYGFKNRAGEVVIPGTKGFEVASDFDGPVAPAVKNGKHGFIDSTGNFKYTLTDVKFAVLSNPMSGLLFFDGHGDDLFMVVDKKGRYGYVNNRAELVVPCRFEGGKRFTEGKAIIYKGNKAGFINKSGETVIEPQFENAYPFSEGRAAVVINGKTGFIDHSGNLVIPANYYHAYYFSEGLAFVTKSEDYNNFFYIDRDGNTAIGGPFEAAEGFSNGEALVQKRGKCKIIDKTGKVIRSGGETCFEGC